MAALKAGAGTASGAMSGAALGLAAGGPWGALGGAVGGGLLGSLNFGGDSGPDYGKIAQMIAGSAETQQRAGEDYTSKAAALREQLKTAMEASKAAGVTGLSQASTNYMAELNPLLSAQTAESNKALLRSTLGAVPQAQQQAREALAATTGLGSGYAADVAGKISEQGLQGYQTGRTALEQQGRAAQITGQGQIYAQQAQQIAQNLGIDSATHLAIMDSGDEALKTAYLQALNTEQRRLSGMIGAETGMGNMNIAQGTENQNALMSGLGAAGNIGANLYAQNKNQDFLTKLYGGSGIPPGADRTSAAYLRNAMNVNPNATGKPAV